MTIKTKSNLLLFLTSLWTLYGISYGHGRLREPPSRSSMWRDGFSNPINYNDNELNCGGMARQWEQNGGQCGVCGDPYDDIRLHEAGGVYANGIIVRNYPQGGTVDIIVEVTAQHQGWFEFRLCPNNNVNLAVRQECLNQYLLEIVGHGTRYYIPEGDPASKIYNLQVVLPAGLTCTQCVIQWGWNAGNSWGVDPDSGEGCIGCGPQEQFYGCSDVAITAA